MRGRCQVACGGGYCWARRWCIRRRFWCSMNPPRVFDIELRNLLWQNVRKLNDDGMTVILTTHYLEEAEAMCDDIAIINTAR